MRSTARDILPTRRTYPRSARRAAALLPLLLAAVSIPASSSVLDPRSIQSETFHNGLQLVVSTDPAAPVVATEIVVKVGSADEPASERGIVHLLEHVLWASAAESEADPRLRVEEVGGVMDGQTLRDYTRFYATVPAGSLATAVEALGRIVLSRSFPDDTIAREQGLVMAEASARSGDPKTTLEEAAFAEVYGPAHPYASPIEGSREDVLSLHGARLSLFAHTWYVPNNMTVVVCGPVAFGEAREAVDRVFGRLAPAALPARAYPPLSRPREAGECSLELPIERAYVMAAYVGPAASEHAEVCASDVLATLLTHTTQGRLVRALTEESDLALSVGVDFLTQRDRALFSIWAVCDPGNIEAVKGVIRHQLASISEEGVPPAELAAAKRLLIAGYAFANETPADRATTLGFYEAVSSYRAASYYPSWVSSVRSADVAAVAQWYSGEPVWITLLPEPSP